MSLPSSPTPRDAKASRTSPKPPTTPTDPVVVPIPECVKIKIDDYVVYRTEAIGGVRNYLASGSPASPWGTGSRDEQIVSRSGPGLTPRQAVAAEAATCTTRDDDLTDRHDRAVWMGNSLVGLILNEYGHEDWFDGEVVALVLERDGQTFSITRVVPDLAPKAEGERGSDS